MPPGHQERQRAAGYRDRHHLRIAEGGIQSGRGRQGGRLRRLTGAHHPGHGQQHRIEEAGLELPNAYGGAQERLVMLHLSAGCWWQQMGMERINAEAQDLSAIISICAWGSLTLWMDSWQSPISRVIPWNYGRRDCADPGAVLGAGYGQFPFFSGRLDEPYPPITCESF